MKAFERNVNNCQLSYFLNLSQPNLASNWKYLNRRCIEISVTSIKATAQYISRSMAIDESVTFRPIYQKFLNLADKLPIHPRTPKDVGEGLHKGKAENSLLLYQK